MPSTHSSLQYHVVFSTKERFPYIRSSWRARLHEYLGGTIRGLGGIGLEVGGTADHVHILYGLKPVHAPSEIIRETKKSSTSFAQEFDSKFRWQEGYGIFTLARRDIADVRAYIRGQEEHHRVRSFQEEYIDFLKSEGIEYDERYLW